jgi:hypothetical protein
MEGVKAAMNTRNLEQDQWRNRTWVEGVKTAMTSRNLEPDQRRFSLQICLKHNFKEK